MSTTPTPFETLVDGLVPFLEGLRAAGYRLEMGQILAAHGLLATMAERGQVPADLRDLRTVLGPILCASENEQKNFALRFRDWVDAIQGDREAQPPVDAPVDVERAVREVEILGRRAQVRARPWIIAGVVVLVGVTVGMIWLVLHWRPAPSSVENVPTNHTTTKTSPDELTAPKPPPDPPDDDKPSPDGSHSDLVLRLTGDLSGGFAVFAGLVFEVLATWWLVRRFSRSWFERAAARMAAGEGMPGGRWCCVASRPTACPS